MDHRCVVLYRHCALHVVLRFKVVLVKSTPGCAIVASTLQFVHSMVKRFLALSKQKVYNA